VPPTSFVHTSLGLTSSELLRRLNLELGRPVARSDQGRTVKRELVNALHGHQADEASIRLNLRGRRRARKWNLKVRRAIKDHGVDVIGDLDDLSTAPVDPSTPTDLATPTEAQLLELAGVARRRLLDYRDELRERVGTTPAPAPEDASPATADDAVASLGDLARDCIDLLVTLRTPHPSLVHGGP
jgi:hypothetical protein